MSRTIFTLPFGPAFLRVTVRELPSGDINDEQILGIDLYADKAGCICISEDLELRALDKVQDFDLFLELRSAAINRDERARLAQANAVLSGSTFARAFGEGL
jgi:hypothetical protein